MEPPLGPGAFVAVVGASGVGKDAVLGWAREHAAAHGDARFPRRAITRPSGAGEDHEPTDADAFAIARDAGRYAVHWEAHGLAYGIPTAADDDVRAGRVVVANVSRSVLESLAARYARLVVVEVTVSDEVRAQRLRARDRESADGIAHRLARADPAPGHRVDVAIENDGVLADAGRRLLDVVEAIAAQPAPEGTAQETRHDLSTPSRSASGYSTWRLIAEELHREIVDGTWPEGARLPTESELSERFGVNRNTVRQAIAALAADGLVASRRGSGTYVTENPVLVHRIGARTRLSASLGDPGRSASRILEWAVEVDPPAEVTDRLPLEGHAALRMETVGSIDGLPLSRATHWFDATRVPGFVDHYRRTSSITAALREVGVDDYLRAATMASARHATVAESADLGMPVGSVVLVTRAVDALLDGTPLHYVVTRWVANRVELDFEPAGG